MVEVDVAGFVGGHGGDRREGDNDDDESVHLSSLDVSVMPPAR